jgi:hypothetical protein
MVRILWLHSPPRPSVEGLAGVEQGEFLDPLFEVGDLLLKLLEILIESVQKTSELSVLSLFKLCITPI